MRNVLRTALLCLLLVAVPLQGFAAGAMLFCGVPQGSAAAVSTAHVHAEPGVLHAHHAHSAHHQPRAERTAPGVEQPGSGVRDPVSQSLVLSDATCSVCASCCSGAALPLSAVFPSVQAEQRAPRVVASQSDPGHAFPGPERPPRRLLA